MGSCGILLTEYEQGGDSMVIRFKGTSDSAEALKREVALQISDICGKDGFTENGLHYTAETISECFFVQPDGDLYVGDELNEEISGQLLQGLMAKHNLIGDMEIIVPRK